MKFNYILIPLIVVLVSMAGRAFSERGLRRWYQTLTLPAFTPDSKTIGKIWTAIFVMSGLSAILFWNSDALLHSDPLFQLTVVAFLVNGFLNAFWSYLFFYLHMLGYAVLEAAALALSVLSLILFTFPVSAWAAWLLVPYLLWSCFATYLTYCTWQLNKAKSS